MSTRRRQHLLTAVAVTGGLALFTYAVRRTGWEEIAEGIARVGWGLVPILALGGLRFVVRAEAWRLCAPRHLRLSHTRALAAFLAGDALGSVTPLGLVASEPTKVYLTRHHLATHASVASLAIDNVIYIASTLTTIATAVVVALMTIPLPFAWQEAGVVAVVLLLTAAVIGVRVLRGEGRTARLVPAVLRERLAGVRTSVREFTSGHPYRLWRVFAIDMTFHALAVLEVYLALEWLLGPASPTLAQAFIFSALNRLVLVLFKFVPFVVGVDEVTSGALAPLLGVNVAAGVALAVVRKVRSLFWAAVGLALIAATHGPAAPATDRPESAPARRT